MSLRNSMWHGLRYIIMRNLIYGKWRNEIKIKTRQHARVSASPFLAPLWRSNRFAGPFIIATKARVKLKQSRIYQIGSLFIVWRQRVKHARWTWSQASYNARDQTESSRIAEIIFQTEWMRRVKSSEAANCSLSPFGAVSASLCTFLCECVRLIEN